MAFFCPHNLNQKCHRFTGRQLCTQFSPVKKTTMAMGSDEEPGAAVPLVRLNHVSFQCASVEESAAFYQRVLGFQLVKRPASLDFRGAW